jgi:hypothetical protein
LSKTGIEWIEWDGGLGVGIPVRMRRGGGRDGKGKEKGKDSTNGTNDHICRIRLKYDRIRPYTEKIRSFTAINAPCTTSVSLRISPYMVTERYARNTEPCNTEKYGRIRSVYTMYTTVYGIVYGRKRSYTESVYVDLGSVIAILDADVNYTLHHSNCVRFTSNTSLYRRKRTREQ